MHTYLQVDVHQSCLQLNDGRLLYGSRKEYQRVLCDLKVLARLLGLLVCLPYKMASSACHTSAPLYGPYSSKVRGHVLCSVLCVCVFVCVFVSVCVCIRTVSASYKTVSSCIY